MTDRPAVPPGWPAAVRPPDTQGWQSSAASWLLDQCPPDYRAYPGWRRHPVALAWVATVHVDAQLDAMRTAYRRIRVELGEHLTPEALRQTMADLESEGVRLLAVSRGAHLVYDALQGKRYVPRL
ncbi:hypothetical protein MM440_14345 [Arsenicicoccus piscis]|nr:hypothetical protein [Arsenicicoccus piscis]